MKRQKTNKPKTFYYVKTPKDAFRHPIDTIPSSQRFRTIKQAKAVAEELSSRNGPAEKWHEVIRVQLPLRGENHSLIAEHRIGHGWMTSMRIGSNCEPYLDWDNVDPATPLDEKMEMIYAAVDKEAKMAVKCHRCGAPVYPQFQQP